MDKGTQQTIGWSSIILGSLVALNEVFAWPRELQYLWGLLVLMFGIWVLVAKK